MVYGFGAWLKKRRRALDFTQDDLAQRAFCSVNTVRKIEADVLTPSKNLARELARALAIPENQHAAFVKFARAPRATAAENAFLEPAAREDVPPPTRDEPVESFAAPEKFQPPAPLTAVIGREHDTNLVAKTILLPSARLVTLTGPPGTGKTRLGLQVAQELSDEFENGAAFVPLAPVAQAALVEAAIAQSLNLHTTPHQSLRAALQTFLRDKKLVLVLDNFEHVLDAAPLVTELLRAAPHLKILATSREPLRVYGERELRIEPLGVPSLEPLPPLETLENIPSVQLFVERAQEVNLDFELTSANAVAIARLCVELEGLPLAIEMAAARVKWQSPQQLLPQLEQRLALSSERRDEDARQQTLRAALDWSYALLEEIEQRVLRQLGVFRGGFTIEAAQTVCEISDSFVLENLVEKSLLKQERSEEDTPRFALLEFIREYALEKLRDADELENARARHYAYFAAFAERAEALLNGEPQTVKNTQFEAEHDNFRAALTWALAQPDPNLALRLAGGLHLFWLRSNHVVEAAKWYVQALDNARASTEPLYLAKAYSGAGSMEWAKGLPRQAAALHTHALAYYHQVNHREGIAFSLNNLAIQAWMQGDSDTAEAYALQALETAKNSKSEWVLNNILTALGTISVSKGDLAQATVYYHQAIEFAEKMTDDRILVCTLWHNLGCIERMCGNYARAAAYFDQAVQLGQVHRLHQITTATLAEQGLLSLKLNKPVEAIAFCRRGARMALEFSFQDLFCANIEWLAAALAYQNQSEHAARLWGAAAALRQVLNMPLSNEYLQEYQRAVAHAHAYLGDARFDQLAAQGSALEPEQLLNGVAERTSSITNGR